MQLEHFALAVPDPVAFAAWYVEHVGCTVARASTEEPYVHFLRLPGGEVMIEVFRPPGVAVPDYPGIDPLQGHLAFQCDGDFESEFRRLIEAGASAVRPPSQSADGGHVAMLRDPWGVPMQLLRRAQPL